MEQERSESARTMPVSGLQRPFGNPDSTLRHGLDGGRSPDGAEIDDPENVDLDDLERMLRQRESALSGPRPQPDASALEREEAELERLARQLSERESELESLRRELDSREGLLDEERRAVEQARVEAAAKDELNERLQGELAARGARIDGEQEQIATLEAWLDAERRNAAALKAEVDAQREELDRLERRLQEAPAPVASAVEESEVLLAGPERSISAHELRGQLNDREEVVRELSARLEQALERINELESDAAQGAPPSLDLAAIKAEAIRQSRNSLEQHGRDVVAVEMESLRARLEEARDHVERLGRDLEEAREAGRQAARELEEARQQNRQMTREAANQFTRLQQDELALRDRIRELENRREDPVEQERIAEMRRRIAELEQRLERGGSARPVLPQEIADYERQLEDYRTNLENAQRDLDRRLKEFDDRCRSHELQISKDRAEIARDRGTMERLRHEFRQEVERAERDPQLYEKLMSLNRVTQEIRAKATHAREEQTTLTSRIREFMRKFGDG
jgi:chromosome segregation ATPase